MSEERKNQLRQYLDQLSPEERAAVYSYAAEQVMKSRRVKADGKVMTLKQLRDKVMKMKEEFDHGVYDESIRTVPRWMLQATARSTNLRTGAEKQLLRQEEEQQLQLDRLGQGAVYSPDCNALDRAIRRINPLHKRDLAWGMFARPERVEQALGASWAGRVLEEVLADSQFYFDILQHCHQMELTLMVRVSRPLALEPLRRQLFGRLQQGVEQLQQPGQEEQNQAALQQFIRLWDDDRLRACSWVDKGQVVKEGTQFIVAATPRGLLTVEAISPGPLSSRSTSVVGTNRNHAVTAAVFDVFLGPRPVDQGGKLAVGNGMLWCANGGRFRLGAGKPSVQHLAAGPNRDSLPVPQGEMLPASPSLFSLLSSQAEAARHMLLRSIQDSQLCLEL